MKKRNFFLFLSLTLLCASILLCVSFVRSPYYALKQMAEDIHTSGVDGLRTHLTERAAETLDVIALLEPYTDSGKKTMEFLGNGWVENQLSEVEWTLEGMDQQGDRACATIGFSIKDMFSGNLDLSMIRKDGEWKIQVVSLARLGISFSQ